MLLAIRPVVARTSVHVRQRVPGCRGTSQAHQGASTHPNALLHPPQVKVLGSCGTTNTSPGLDDEFPDDEGQNARSHPLYESLQARARAPRLRGTTHVAGPCQAG